MISDGHGSLDSAAWRPSMTAPIVSASLWAGITTDRNSRLEGSGIDRAQREGAGGDRGALVMSQPETQGQQRPQFLPEIVPAIPVAPPELGQRLGEAPATERGVWVEQHGLGDRWQLV